MSSTKLSFYRPDLDGLRGIAVLLVVFFHYFPDYFWGGFIGVDIFFVISGFLISSILFRGAESGQLKITEFYSRRFRRIFPALIVVLVATYALGWVLLLADEYKQLGKHMAAAGGFISNFVLWREAGYFNIPNDHKPLMHLWSLGIEEQFYLCWPLLLFLGRRMRIPLLQMILVLSVVSFALNLDWIIADDTADFFSPASRAWELLIGALIARLITWKDRLPAYALEAGAIAGFLLIGLAEIVLNRGSEFPGSAAVLPVLGAALLIFTGPSTRLHRLLLTRRSLVGLGLLSYPIYLWHYPLMSFAKILGLWSVSSSFVLLALCLLAAWATYLFVEKPIRFGGRISTGHLASALVLASLAGVVTYSSDGILFRTKSLGDMPASAWSLRPLLPECKHSPSETAGTCFENMPDRDPAVAVIGDCHVLSVLKTFENVNETSAPTKFITKPACAPFQGSCPEVSHGLEWAASTPSVKVVFLVGKYSFYLNTDDKRQLSVREEKFAFDLAKTVKTLRAAGKRVVFVHELPELDFDPRSCLSRPFIKANRICSEPVETVHKQQSNYRQIAARVLVKFPGVEELDPVPVFCDTVSCYAMKDSKMLYLDHDHLNAQGAELLHHVLETFIKNETSIAAGF